MQLKPKLSLIFVFAAMIPFLLIGSATYVYVKSSMEQRVFDGVRIFAEVKETSLYLYLDKLKATAINFASDGFVRETTKSISRVENEDVLAETLSQHLLDTKIPLNKDVLSIDIIGMDGTILSSTQNKVGRNISDEIYFIAGKQALYINDIRHHEMPELLMSTPIFDLVDMKKTIGVMVIHYSIEPFRKLFAGTLISELGAKSRGIGRTGETYLVNENRLMISNSIFVEDASFNLVVDTYPVRMNLEQNKEVVGIWRDYRGVEVVGASMSIFIDDVKWTLITEQDADEAFAEVENLKLAYILIFIFFLIIIGALVLLNYLIISKNVIQPICLLTQKMEQLGEENARVNINEICGDDEIGSFAKTFERTSTRLNQTLEDIQQKNQMLQELSNKDGLTGLYNHRYLKEILEVEFNNSYRYKTPLCYMMIDIDHFKVINDTYGHLFGDLVLRGVAAVIVDACRKSDIVARYGGEEFAVLMPNTDLEQGQIVADKLYAAIKSVNYCDGTNRIAITVSIGVSWFHEGLEKYIDMLAEADQAMYSAKRSGRDRICIYGEKQCRHYASVNLS